MYWSLLVCIEIAWMKHYFTHEDVYGLKCNRSSHVFVLHDIVIQLSHSATQMTKNYLREVVFKNLTNLDLDDNISYYVIN